MDLAALRVDNAIEAAMPIIVGEVRPMTETDITVLSTSDREQHRGGAGQPALERLTRRHHALARVLASGEATTEQAAIIVGLATGTVRHLRTDPAFKELVKFYEAKIEDVYMGLHEKMAGLSIEAAEELQRRLEDEPEKLGAGFLLDVVTKTADRTGFGPATKSTQEVNVTVGIADRMAAARKRAVAAIEGSMRDITPGAVDSE